MTLKRFVTGNATTGTGTAHAQTSGERERPGPLRWLFEKVAWFVHHAVWRARLIEYTLPLVEREIRSTVRVPLHVRPVQWWRGFLSESWTLYNFAINDWRSYLTDYQRFVPARTINGGYSILLDDKLQFARLFASRAEFIPTHYGVLSDGRVLALEGDRTGSTPLLKLVREHGAIVLKPSSGGGGKGFALLKTGDRGEILLNGEPTDTAALDRAVASRDGCMVTSHVRQHPEIAALYPRTTNTIRLITLQDDVCEPFVAAAVLRIGSARSAPTDNWSQGGLSAPINLEDGTLGMGAIFPAHADRLAWHTRHPETGAAIAGARIPNWDRIVADILRIAGAFPFLRYVGWDMAVTDEGFCILEGNNFTNVNLFQIHAPLLSDPRTADFFRRHGVVGRRQR